MLFIPLTLCFVEIALIILVILLLIGGRRIPELMRGIGRGISNFRSSSSDIDDQPNQSENK